MKKRSRLLLGLLVILILSFALTLAACGGNTATDQAGDQTEAQDQTQTQAAAAFEGQYVVNAQYVKDSVGKDNVLLVDARGPETAAKGTVEGAIAVNWQMFSDVANGKSGDAMWGILLSADKMNAALNAAGISPSKEVVVFGAGSGGWGDEGRIVWTLLAAGFTNVKMADCGYDALVTSGVPTAQSPAAYTPCTDNNITALDESHDINTDALKADYDSYKVVDVRADEEYNGETLYGEANGGHLPGAIHIKFTDLFNNDGTLKSNADIEAMFTAANIAKTDKIVTYCTKGIRSAYMQLILQMCGYENTCNYDESYYRWCNVNEVEK